MIQSSHYFYLRKHSAAIVQQDFFTFHVTWYNKDSQAMGIKLNYMQNLLHMGNNFVSDGHVCNTFCPVLQKLVDVGLKTF